MRRLRFVFAIAAISLAGCSDENKTTPAEDPTDVVLVNQEKSFCDRSELKDYERTLSFIREGDAVRVVQKGVFVNCGLEDALVVEVECQGNQISINEYVPFDEGTPLTNCECPTTVPFELGNVARTTYKVRMTSNVDDPAKAFQVALPSAEFELDFSKDEGIAVLDWPED